MHIREGEHFLFIRSILLSLPVLLLATYFIIFFGVRKYLIEGKTAQFILIVALAGAVVLLGRWKWLELVNWLNFGFTGSMPITKVLKNVIRDYAVVALAVCLYIIGDWKRKEKETRRLIEAKAQSDLELLKQQLHPHFLFNTLNNIYSLVLNNQDPNGQAAESILKLSRLMEYLVYQSGTSEGKLNEEIVLVQDYLDLERLRHGDGLEIEFNVTGIDESIFFAPLVLLPFVENCFKHGGRNQEGLFVVKIFLLFNKGILDIEVTNSKAEKGLPKVTKGGVGIQNISNRLNLLYPNRYSLQIDDQPSVYSVRLKIELK